MSEALDAKVATWTGPVPGAAPAGADVRYDPSYETLAKELAKLDAPQGTPVDWQLVEREASAILSAKSKDLLVASWLTAALHERSGLDGLATGLWGLASVVDTYWDGLFPSLKRIKGRTSALTWLVERTVVRLERHNGPLEHDTVDRLVASAKRFQRIVPDRFGEHAPGTRPLGDAIERIRLSLPPRPAAAAPPPAPAPAAAPAPSPAPAAQTPPPAVAPAPAAAAPAPAAPAAPDAPKEPSHADVLEARARDLLAPIPGAAPAGADGRYDPEHEGLRGEIAKLENPAAGGVDWKGVQSRGRAFLTGKSKDLLIASYVACAEFELNGLDGLSTGLAVLSGVVGGFWDGVHPNRVRARANALTWLLTRVELAINAPTPPPGSKDRVVVERLAVAARSFAAVVRDKFADEAPGLRPLLDGVERLKMSLPAAAPPPPPPPAPVAAAPPPPPPAPAAPAPAAPAPAAPAAAGPAVAMPAAPAATLAAGADPTPFLQQIGNSLVQASVTLRTADAAAPTSYRIRRIGLYLHVQAPPPVSAAPKTSVPAPTDKLRQQLLTLQRNAKWAALLEEAESAIGTARYWLDLHRFVCLALEGLGHAAAREAVVHEVVHLVRRFPQLVDLAFADGTPFAAPETKEWLKEISPAGGGESAPTDDPIAATIKEARALASGGKRDDALKALTAAVRSAPDDRARFRLRLASARICASSNAVPVARGLFEGLVADIDTMRLDVWEPDLAADALRAYHDLLRAVTRDPKEAAKLGPRVAEEAADVYRRLCRIDPLAAMAGV